MPPQPYDSNCAPVATLGHGRVRISLTPGGACCSSRCPENPSKDSVSERCHPSRPGRCQAVPAGRRRQADPRDKAAPPNRAVPGRGAPPHRRPRRRCTFTSVPSLRHGCGQAAIVHACLTVSLAGKRYPGRRRPTSNTANPRTLLRA